MIARKASDEQKHGRIYFDAVLERGWAENRRELFNHQYAQALFGMKMFVAWLNYVGASHPAVQHCGDSYPRSFSPPKAFMPWVNLLPQSIRSSRRHSSRRSMRK